MKKRHHESASKEKTGTLPWQNIQKREKKGETNGDTGKFLHGGWGTKPSASQEHIRGE